MTISVEPAAVSFDVYSALVDSRTGAVRILAALARRRRWAVAPESVYGAWDARNKALQRDEQRFTPFRILARRAWVEICDELQINTDPEHDIDLILSSMGGWPHYTDVTEGVAAVAERFPVALLTNIDDDLLERTNTGWHFDTAVTSEQARAYKPHPAIYHHAESRLGTPLLHVAASARDTQGALGAGLDVVRIRRPGAALDPDGPQPTWEIDDLRELAELLR